LSRDHQIALRQSSDLSERRGNAEQRRQQAENEATSLRARSTELLAVGERIERELTELSSVSIGSPDGVTARAAELRADLAALRERLAGIDGQLERAVQRTASINRLLASRQSDIDAIIAANANVEVRVAHLDATIAATAEQLEEDRAKLTPLDRERTQTTETLERADRELSAASERLREAERERDRSTLALARVQDEQVFVQERINNDLELIDPTTLVAPDDAPPPTDAEIARVRERLRRMSVVSDDVLEQHETESERLSFLTQQLSDVDAAADGLRKVLAELNSSMATRFNDTFRDVATMFEQTFTRLFGGGAARLVMNSADDGATGIDIVAQPPGKRLQNLNALSGGERALTAVALLMAIQRVNPSPFCLLDEVDAALDESNVVRFRDELRELVTTTQFVIITHNRGTIEGADTLYGVTMGDDGVSRVLSLRLDEAIEAVDEYATTASASA
jgi:chromosome segregation protein